MTTELVFNQAESDWNKPESYPDLSNRSIIAVDLETKSPNTPNTALKEREIIFRNKFVRLYVKIHVVTSSYLLVLWFCHILYPL